MFILKICNIIGIFIINIKLSHKLNLRVYLTKAIIDRSRAILISNNYYSGNIFFPVNKKFHDSITSDDHN